MNHSAMKIMFYNCLFLALPGLFVSGMNAPTEGDRVNVLLIMTDTQRKDDMGAYGNPVIRTPNQYGIIWGLLIWNPASI